MERERHQRRTQVQAAKGLLPQGHYSQGVALLQTHLSLEACPRRILHLLPNATTIFLGASHRRTLPSVENAPI